jgi:RNA polymerase sigma-70 factor (ECF subfamily)
MGVAEADVDDVLQEVFLAVHRGLPGFQGRSSDRTWVYGICLRTCSNYRQRAHRRRERLVAVSPERGDTRTPERALGTRDALQRLDAALGELSEVQRAAFVLYEIEGLSVLEVAQAAGCSKFTVYARLYAARRRVRRALADEMGDPTMEVEDA